MGSVSLFSEANIVTIVGCFS